MTTTVATFIMDPQSDLDYQFDWSTWLAVGETIIAFTVTVPTGITLGVGAQAPSQSAGKVTYWLAGGTNGATYHVVCHITTSAGRQDDAVHRIKVLDLAVGYSFTPSSGIQDIDGGTP